MIALVNSGLLLVVERHVLGHVDGGKGHVYRGSLGIFRRGLGRRQLLLLALGCDLPVRHEVPGGHTRFIPSNHPVLQRFVSTRLDGRRALSQFAQQRQTFRVASNLIHARRADRGRLRRLQPRHNDTSIRWPLPRRLALVREERGQEVCAHVGALARHTADGAGLTLASRPCPCHQWLHRARCGRRRYPSHSSARVVHEAPPYHPEAVRVDLLVPLHRKALLCEVVGVAVVRDLSAQ
mmetsp:Transcript_23927/g.56661  ORF Transcript_23927/g.56661 Transcript_23927/m.56661 type:complete len:237 (-) Transcript_23927:1256-1966(-)